MTVLGNRATRVPQAGVGVGVLVTVGLAAVALGLVVGLSLRETMDGSSAAAQTTGRATAVSANLTDVWESGLAQQQAMREQVVVLETASEIPARTTAGLAQLAAIKGQSLLQARIEAGIAQRDALAQRQALVQNRIESGRAQSRAMTGTGAFLDAWTMRGRETSKHDDALTSSGLVQGAIISDA